MTIIHVLAFAGSLRSASLNRGLIRAAAELAPATMRLEVADLGAIPLYNQDLEDAGEPIEVVEFKAAIEAADALLIATPEYNHGTSGVLKNAIDWASRPRATSPLTDKPVAVIGASPGRGATARAQAQLRETFVFTGACAMPQPELLVSAVVSHFDGNGNLRDPETREALGQLLLALERWTYRLSTRSAA